MVSRLLFISGLLCIIFASGLQAQQLKVVAETETFKDYELVNEELKVLSPYEIAVPTLNGTPQFQVLEQSIVDVDTTISEDQAIIFALSDINEPVISASPPANDRGRMISSLSINLARVGDSEAKILRKIRLRVYKNGDVMRKTSARKAATALPLSSGTWYKIPVQKNGIYELTYSYLSDLGIDVTSINVENIQLWGTDGYPLAEANDAPRPQFVQIPLLADEENDRLLFYGNSPHKVVRDGSDFSHQLSPYSDTKYVFLTIGQENGARLSPSNTNMDSPSRTITTFTDFIWKDEELHKVEESIKSGREWLGQRFGSSSNGTLTTVLRDTIPGLSQNSQIQLRGEFVARSERTSTFDVFLNGEEASSVFLPSIPDYISTSGNAGQARSFNTTLNPGVQNGVIEIEARYNHSESNSTGYVNWLELTFERNLTAKNNRLFFHSPANGSANEVVQYQLSGFNQQPIIMDVTNVQDPKLLSVNSSGSSHNLTYYSGNDLQLIAQSEFFTPGEGEQIETTNLRGIAEYPDYIIVTSEEFLEPAQELANYRINKDGLTPVIVTQEQILNEFSGGAVDPSAIRDYVKFLYDRAQADNQQLPRYLLLFGDTTFDYKNIVENGFTNYVITYQSTESLERTRTFATDDFFGFLDDEEGQINNGSTSNNALIDIGIGRIPSQTQSEAAIAVQKIKTYENSENTGDWQNQFTFAADDDLPKHDEDLHVLNADGTAERMNIIEPGIRLNKIYLPSYPEEITGSGRKIPGATDDFVNALNNGTLVLNYSGHGNERSLTDEGLFSVDDIPRLNNSDKLAVLATATCQFGRYDDINAQSGAEKLFFAENGGVVAAFTTTRVVYTSPSITANHNYGLNISLSQHMLEKNEDGSAARMGDIYRNTKNARIGSSLIVANRNSKKFILLGDPAAKLQVPENNIVLNTITTNEQPEAEDDTLTIRALDRVRLTGQITDNKENPLSGFTGEATITVFDAPRMVRMPQDRSWVIEDNCHLSDCSYKVETDILFKGKAAVQNGFFTSTFIIPKDISSSDSTGRIVLYAAGNETSAGGSFSSVKFQGVNPDANDDGYGPKLNVFLNDERFVNGNLVNSSPNLIIELEDQSGINTTGTGVGHEIIATIDTKPQQSIVLNEFYEGELDDYTRGRIEYPLDQLPEGNYSLKVRAWDVHNNASEQEIFFEVASDDNLDIRNVYNYPNPMSNVTRFTFEHNQPGNLLDVSVRIFTLSGRPVQHLKEELITTSSYASISWDGRDRDYDRLGNGTYIYVLRVTTDTPEGRETAEKIEKLVIIR